TNRVMGELLRIGLASIALIGVAAFGCTSSDRLAVDSVCVGSKCDGRDSGEPREGSYFDQFLYRVDPSSEMPFQFLVNALLWELPGGERASVELYLLDVDTYFVELRLTNMPSDQGRLGVVDGSYWVEDGELVLAGLGRARPARYEDREALELSFERDYFDLGLREARLDMIKVSSTGGLFHVLGASDDGVCDAELGEFCAYGADCGPCVCGDGVCQRARTTEGEHSCPADCAAAQAR
ncbi:MAG: hypothetical protein KJO07_04815, partial [Deltaproteobacteria bacterium]|nr:hypothetical protein [Deltaproteobacteria bacterium]